MLTSGYRLMLVRSTPIPPVDLSAITSTGDVYTTAVRKGKRRLAQVSVDSEGGLGARRVWKASCDSAALASAARITCTLPVDLGLVILGCSASYRCLTGSS